MEVRCASIFLACFARGTRDTWSTMLQQIGPLRQRTPADPRSNSQTPAGRMTTRCWRPFLSSICGFHQRTATCKPSHGSCLPMAVSTWAGAIISSHPPMLNVHAQAAASQGGAGCPAALQRHSGLSACTRHRTTWAASCASSSSIQGIASTTGHAPSPCQPSSRESKPGAFSIHSSQESSSAQVLAMSAGPVELTIHTHMHMGHVPLASQHSAALRTKGSSVHVLWTSTHKV